MPSWKDKLNGDPVPWLLEHDRRQPGVRYFTLRDILGRDENDSEVKAAKAAIMVSGPVPAILAAQHPEGYWGKKPRYTGTLHAVLFMAQFGADGVDPRIRRGCEFLLSRYIDNNGAPLGGLSLKGTPSGFNCMAGEMGAALIDFGWLHDPRLQTAMEWLARTITGERVAGASSRDPNKPYNTSGKAPPFACASRNANLPCAWGAIKAMVALNKVPPAQRTENMHAAIKQGVDFLLSRDPAVADYPFGPGGNRPSSTWFKFYYPLRGEADVLQNLEVLAALGQAENPRLANALALVISKQDQQGRWLLEYTFKVLADTQEERVPYWYQNVVRLYVSGKELADIQEKKGRPSKWVTLRALRVLKAAYPEKG